MESNPLRLFSPVRKKLNCLCLFDGDKPGANIYNKLKADFHVADTDKLIMVTAVSEAKVEDLLPKAKLAKVIACFFPRPEEEFDDAVADNKPICIKLKSSLKRKVLIWVMDGKFA